MADIEEQTPYSDAVVIHIPKSQRRMLHRVPVQLRRDKTHIYEPVVVSLGPYHHRRDPQLELVEPFKDELRDIVCGGDDRKSSLLSNIFAQIDDIRDFYSGAADRYTDEELAEMMLRDACFLICYMRGFCKDGITTYFEMCERMGRYAMLFVSRDMFMLENQIPLWLISLIHPDPNPLLSQYLIFTVYGKDNMVNLPWIEIEPPLHLLEALRRTFLHLVETQQNSSLFLRLIKKYNQPMEPRKESSTAVWQQMNNQFRSVTDLKAKGIHLRRSSNCLTDINFFSFGVLAQLQLPIFFVREESIVFFSNIIAFEMSPGVDADFGVASYFNFMKTLIHNANDVKVLREKGILYSMLANDEEVVEMFKSINTYGFSNTDIFYEVKKRIDKHCKSKARTWMADLINTKFQSPWAFLGLLAAIILLCLTFLQTYYTINPRNKSN